MAKSLDTKYQTVPTEAVFSVDPFKAMSNTTLNAIYGGGSESGGIGKGLGNLIGATGGTAINSALMEFVNTGKVSKEQVLGKLKDTLKIDTGFLTNSPIAKAGDYLKNMGLIDDKTANFLSGKDSSMSITDVIKNTKNTYNMVKSNGEKVVDGFKQIGNDIKDAFTYDSVSDFLNTLNSVMPGIAEGLQLQGMGEEIFLISDIVKTAVHLNVGPLIDSLVDEIKDDKVKKAVIVSNISSGVYSSNVDFLNKALEILGPGAVKAASPTIVSDLLSSYKPTNKDLPLQEQTNELLNLLSRIDNNWDKINRDGELVYNIDAFNKVSPYVRSLFLVSDNIYYKSLAMTANKYPIVKPMDIAKKYYPYI